MCESYVVDRLELLPSLSEVYGSRIFLQLAGLHLNECQVLQVQTTAKRVRGGEGRGRGRGRDAHM